MKIQSNGIQPFQSSSVASGLGAKTFKAIADCPILATTDVLDAGIGAAQAFGSFSGNAGNLMLGGSVVMGGYHAVKAFSHMCMGIGAADRGATVERNNNFVKMTGDALSAVGMFTAAAGCGPISLAFVGLGGVVTNARTLTE